MIVKNNRTNEFLSVIPELGARLKDLYLCNQESIIPVLRIYKPGKLENRDDLFTNAKLFPFAGRIKDGKYTFEDRNYCLPINYPEEGNVCHGLVYDKKFEIVDETIKGKFASCTLIYNYNNEYAGYPFKVDIEIMYKLESKLGLTCTTRIVNNSITSLPLGDG